MHPIACTQCGHAISPTSFECPYCGATGPNRTGREPKGMTRGRWTLLCLGLLGLALLFPPTYQHGEYTVDGRTSEVNHRFMPSWIGSADAGPDVGYTRNGQMQTITWNITREINRPAWAVVLGSVILFWVIGMLKPRRRRAPASAPAPAPAPVRYHQEIVPMAGPPRSPVPDLPARPEDRAVQPPARKSRPLYPGVSIPGDVGSVRNGPPPPGRYR